MNHPIRVSLALLLLVLTSNVVAAGMECCDCKCNNGATVKDWRAAPYIYQGQAPRLEKCIDACARACQPVPATMVLRDYHYCPGEDPASQQSPAALKKSILHAIYMKGANVWAEQWRENDIIPDHSRLHKVLFDADDGPGRATIELYKNKPAELKKAVEETIPDCITKAAPSIVRNIQFVAQHHKAELQRDLNKGLTTGEWQALRKTFFDRMTGSGVGDRGGIFCYRGAEVKSLMVQAGFSSTPTVIAPPPPPPVEPAKRRNPAPNSDEGSGIRGRQK